MNEDLLRVLTDARRLVGQRDVMLRVEAANLETVYVGELDGQWLASDRGETFMFLASERATYEPWSAETARHAIQGLAVELVGEETEHEAWYRIQAAIGESTVLASVVALVADAIDRVFQAHLQRDHR